MMRLASYKGTRPGLSGLFNVATRWWLGGPYSHTELIFSDGACASSSFLDGGVRFKRIEFDPEHWDIIDCLGDEDAARAWFDAHEGDGYDVLGLIGFVWRRSTHERGKWFCNEAIGAALGIPDPWRFEPVTFPILISQRVK